MKWNGRDVFTCVEGSGPLYAPPRRVRIGRAFELVEGNPADSVERFEVGEIQVHLDALPVNGKLILGKSKERE